jgi:hypothetical protein
VGAAPLTSPRAPGCDWAAAVKDCPSEVNERVRLHLEYGLTTDRSDTPDAFRVHPSDRDESGLCGCLTRHLFDPDESGLCGYKIHLRALRMGVSLAVRDAVVAET